jgi:hypothetical protein
MPKAFFKYILLTAIGLHLCLLAAAQTLSGTVADEQNQPVPTATVFISGTEKITTTDNNGLFTFSNLKPGAYQVIIKMLGYAPATQNVMVRQDNVNIQVVLIVEAIGLKEITIGGKDVKWDEKYELFKENFLGISKYGRNCKILNPKVLSLKRDRKTATLEAKTDDFLIIDNPQLGYKIKYLLKAFEYHYNTGIANYDGDAYFEEMKGTPEQKQKWRANRLKVYQGSLMHFLRSVYAGRHVAEKEGFGVRLMLPQPMDISTDELNERMRPPVLVDSRPVRFEKLVDVVDTSFIALKFSPGLMIVYNPKKVAANKVVEFAEDGTATMALAGNASILQLALTNAIIDSRGNFTDYRAFLMRGRWGEMRLGDQLPFEYQP